MKTTRRNFLKQGVLLGGGAILLRPTAARSEPASATETNPTLQTIHHLRSIHGNFIDKPLPDGALETILAASVRAANASNNQSYAIVVIKDRRRMRDVCGYRGSCVLVYCADYGRAKATAASLGYTYEPNTVVDFVTATINTTLAAQTAVIAAKSLGIDSLVTNGVHRGDIERHWKLLDLPDTQCFPILAVVLGYPTNEPTRRAGRLTGTGVVHAEKYHALTKEEVDQLIRAYDDPSRELGLVGDWAGKGHKHYLEWYFKEWIRVGDKTEKQETAMLRRLKRSGFIETFA